MLLVLVLLMTGTVFADTVDDRASYVTQHAPDLNDPEHLTWIAEFQRASEDVLPMMATRGGGKRLLNVPLYQQNTRIYCGPACIQMVLSYFGISASQSDIARIANTDNDGFTYVYQARDALNYYLGSGSYDYVGTWQTRFVQGLITSIDAGKPVLCHVETGELPIYKSYGESYPHYVVAIGYYWGQGGGSGVNEVTYNDPHFDARFYGTHTCTIDVMEQVIDDNAGFYIAGT